MTTHLTAAQVERLRRDAKKLARKRCIPLHAAQRLPASKRGFKNWSLMIRVGIRAPESQLLSTPLDATVLAGMLRHTSNEMTLFYIHRDSPQTSGKEAG